jgi:hypothetical protein
MLSTSPLPDASPRADANMRPTHGLPALLRADGALGRRRYDFCRYCGSFHFLETIAASPARTLRPESDSRASLSLTDLFDS